MKQDIRQYVEQRLPRENDKELFRGLLEAYNKGGPDEAKKAIQSLILGITEA